MSTTKNELKKPQDERDDEIEQVKDGMPKVKGFWEMVAKELDEAGLTPRKDT